MVEITKHKRIVIGAAALLLLLTLFGCSRETAELGTQQEPFVWFLSPEGDLEQLQNSAEQIAAQIYELTGYHVRTSIASSEAAVLSALAERPTAAHITTLSAAAYLHASNRGSSAAALLGAMGGEQYSRAYFITHQDSGIGELSDLFSESVRTPRMAIATFGSLSGHIMPLIHLREAGLEPDSENFSFIETGGDAEVIAAVYRGEAVAGAITENLLEELSATEAYEDLFEQVSVFGRTDPVPVRGLQFSPVVAEIARRQILNALLQLNERPTGQELIFGLYGWEALSEHGDEPYEPLRELMRSTNVSLEDIQL